MGSLSTLSLLQFSQLLVLLSLLIYCNKFTAVHAQQAPNPFYQIEAFTEPSFVKNGTLYNTFRNDVCYLAEHRTELGLTTILEGVALHPVLMISEFTNFDYEYNDPNDETKITNMTLNKDYPGLVPLLMDELCERAGCTWRDTYAAYPYDVLEEKEKGFSDLLYWSADVFDVTLDWWMRSVERLRNGATFTEKWYDASIILVAKEAEADDSDKGFDPFSWLYPFDNNVWYLTIGTILASAFVYWFLERLNPNADNDDGHQLNMIETTWMFATAFAGQFEFDPRTPAARLFTFSIAFWALLMGAAYTANLASFLVIQNKPQNPIETVQQATRASIPMCVWKSSVTDSSVSAAFPAYAGSGLLVRKTTQKEVFLGLRTGECQLALTEVSSWEAFQYDDEVNGDCKLQWIGRAFEFIPASFALTSDAGVRCTSLLRAVFDLHLHDMEREGVIARLWEGHIEQTATVFCNNDNNDEERRRRLQDGHFRLLKAAQNAAPESNGNSEFDETTKLNLSNMGGVFLLHYVLTFIALMIALISWCRSRKEEDHSNTTLLELPPPKGEIVGSVREGSVISEPYFDAVEGAAGTAAVDVLRAEMNAKLHSMDQKLEMLLGRQANGAGVGSKWFGS